MAAYAREVRPSLPEATFAPARSRVLWLPVHATLIAFVAWALATGHLPWPLWPVASLVIGCSMAGVTFLGHETMHGGVVRGRWAIRVVGWFGFLPFCVSPQLWMAWHNRVHHNHCGQPGVDPDMYPTLEQYQNHRSARIMADYFGIGRRRVMSLLSLAFGFTGQSSQILYHARSCGYLSKRLHRRAILETLLGVAFWATVAGIVGFVPFLFIYALPLVVANSIVMMFIVTNHNLSPLTPTNDPLVNSLSVTLPRVLEWLTLDFGYHTEHHVFPTLSTRHGAGIRAALVAHYPERYQSMPLTRALHKLYTTARVYKDNTTLIDPPTGATWPTLVPSQTPQPSAPP
jgi:fatty acid desaturase